MAEARYGGRILSSSSSINGGEALVECISRYPRLAHLSALPGYHLYIS